MIPKLPSDLYVLYRILNPGLHCPSLSNISTEAEGVILLPHNFRWDLETMFEDKIMAAKKGAILMIALSPIAPYHCLDWERIKLQLPQSRMRENLPFWSKWDL